jgi:spermidine synthase
MTPAAINTDFRPVLYLLRLRQWLSQFSFPASGFALVVALAIAACLVRFKPVPRIVFAAGFAASALEVAALVAFQVFYGSLYQQVGLVVAVFMAGLALGAIGGGRLRGWSAPLAVRNLAVGIAFVGAAFGFVLPAIGRLDRWTGTPVAGEGAVLLLTFLLAALVGLQFALASAAAPSNDSRAAPPLFSADLLGAAAGAVVVSGFMLPAWGLTSVCLVVAGLNLVTAILASGSSRHS